MTAGTAYRQPHVAALKGCWVLLLSDHLARGICIEAFQWQDAGCADVCIICTVCCMLSSVGVEAACLVPAGLLQVPGIPFQVSCDIAATSHLCSHPLSSLSHLLLYHRVAPVVPAGGCGAVSL
jgi:hypothetical protein